MLEKEDTRREILYILVTR